VVGVDGSAGSQAALVFAVAEAVMRNGAVHAVHVWQHPHPYGDGWVPDGDEFATNAAHILDHAISLAGEAAADEGPTPPMVAVLEHGDPAEKLLAAAVDATLLVVGSRGHGGFAGMMLGSVGRHCTIHSPCPVVVVRGRSPAAPAGPGGTGSAGALDGPRVHSVGDR
jgi:nucleotide-binding universal stress UspA family protein